MFDGISDIHLCEGNLGESMVFPGPLRATEAILSYADALLVRCKACGKADFMITFDGLFFRGRKETRAVDGVWYHLRKMPSIPPSLDTLPSRLPPILTKMLMTPRLREGGLIYVIGPPGAGKTTTASAAVVSRLHSYGGFAYTVEDPPEMPLNGWHAAGYCRQTWVAGDTSADWAESFRGVLRSQPAGTPTILYVGEVRDAESAQAMLRAASNGFLVIATGFGTDIVAGIDALSKLSGQHESSLTMLASVLRLVVHQRLHNGQMVATSLASVDARGPVAAKIRSGTFTYLVSDVQFQSNQAMLGVNVFDARD